MSLLLHGLPRTGLRGLRRRHGPRNRFVASTLHRAGLVTLLLDLLSPGEQLDRANVFNIELLARRLTEATGWLGSRPDTASCSVGYFGASTGAGAALWAAADLGEKIGAVVSRGGRPDLAGARLAFVRAPTLLIVGSADHRPFRGFLSVDNDFFMDPFRPLPTI